MKQEHALVHWPGWSQLAWGIGLGLGVGLVFTVIYGGTEWLATQHTWRIRLHLPIDLQVPLVPAAMPLYLSLNLLMWMSVVVLRMRRELMALATTMCAAIVLAGLFFALVPAVEAFERPSVESLGRWGPWFEFAWALTLRGNFAPSLHVTFTIICVAAYWPYCGALSKFLIAGWGAAIIVSTLLTHQHYIADVFSGGLLALAVLRWVHRRMLREWRTSSAAEKDRASPSPHLVQSA